MFDPFFKLRCFARVWRRKIWQSPVTWRYQKHTGQAKQPAKPQWHSPASGSPIETMNVSLKLGGSEGSMFRRYTNKNIQIFKCFVLCVCWGWELSTKEFHIPGCMFIKFQVGTVFQQKGHRELGVFPSVPNMQDGEISTNKMSLCLAIQSDLFGMVKWPF